MGLLPLVASGACVADAREIAARLGTQVLVDAQPRALTEPDFVLELTCEGLFLQQTGPKAPHGVAVDFTQGAVDHRRKFGGGNGQMIAKACGVKSGCYPLVLDATAGLGRDAFVLASLGCTLGMVERAPEVYELLRAGLAMSRARAEGDPELAQILTRMQLAPARISSLEFLQRLAGAPEACPRPHVIYLDPMFPSREKSADVKKDMKAFHSVVGADLDADALLPLAIAQAEYRVVVKRPRKAPFLNGATPSYQLEGKSSRFDIYTRKKMPDALQVPSDALHAIYTILE